MADTGWLSPSSATSVSFVDSLDDWNTPTNCLSSNDSRAGATAFSADKSEALAAYNFGADLPDDAEIDGIEVEIEGYDAGDSSVTVSVYLAKSATSNSSTVTAAKTTTSFPEGSGAEDYVSFGGSSDTWGVSWSVSEFNASGFGVWVRVQCSASSTGVAIDHIRLKITYTTAGGAQVIFIGV